MISDEEIRPGVRILRNIIRFIVACFYRIEIEGSDNVPRTGPVLFVSNHLSYADPMVISAATSKPIRFLMWQSIYEWKAFKWLFNLMRAIPIDLDGSPRKLLASIKETRHALIQGDRVGLFAEGAISRFSQTRGFKRGMELIMKDLAIPIIPIHIDRMWGSIFSFERGRFIWKFPRLRRLPITISFGPALPSNASSFEVREVVLELGSAAFGRRLEGKKPLQEAFLSNAKKRWFAPCLIDSNGIELFSYGQLATKTIMTSQFLRKSFPGEAPIGVLLHNSPECTISILSLLFAGKLPVLLNPELSKEKLESYCLASGVSQLLTIRGIHKYFGFTFQHQVIYLDDIPIESRIRQIAVALAIRFLPRKLASCSETAAILFPKDIESQTLPVSVSHDTINACLIGLKEVLSISSKDTVASALPIADSLISTAALWWPLLEGARIKHVGDTILVEQRFALTRQEPSTLNKTEVPVLTAYSCPEIPIVCISALNVCEGGEDQRGGKKGTVGRPLPGICVRIVDPITGQRLPPKTPGLLHIKHAKMDKIVSASLSEDGWFITGEHAKCDEEGFVSVLNNLEISKQVDPVTLKDVNSKNHNLSPILQS